MPGEGRKLLCQGNAEEGALGSERVARRERKLNRAETQRSRIVAEKEEDGQPTTAWRWMGSLLSRCLTQHRHPQREKEDSEKGSLKGDKHK